jgi:hypothetical protein
MQDQHGGVEKRLADVEEVLRDLVARVVALEERLAGRTQVVVDELDELRTDVEQLKETVTPGEGRLIAHTAASAATACRR